MGKIKAPAPLNEHHDISTFDCGNSTLNEWLQKKALRNQKSGASRTFVACDNDKVAGFYALASGSIERIDAPKTLSRNMPDPIPVVVLGRLAVALPFQNQRIGKNLLKDAILRVASISESIGLSALIVHTLNEEAKLFYTRYGFQESPMDTMTLFLSTARIIEKRNFS